MTLSEAIALYAKVEGALQKAHGWRTWCNQWDAEYGARDVLSITAEDVNRVVLVMRKRGLAESTVAAKVNALKQVFRVARRVGGVATLKFPEDVARIRERTQRVRDLRPSEEIALKRAMHPRDWDIVELTILLGLRSAELFNLKRRDVDFVGGFATIRGSTAQEAGAKGGYTRRMPLNNSKVRRILKTMIERNQDSEYVVVPKGYEKWTSRKSLATTWKQKVFRPALRAAGIDDYRFHDNRHACGSRLAQKNVSLYKIQHYLGHKSPAMTQRYAHLNDEAMKQVASLL